MKPGLVFLITLLLSSGSLWLFERDAAQLLAQTPPADSPANSKVAPEFPTYLKWFNSDNSLKLSDLKGRVVLLDFWTYCCINCLHVLPDLAFLEEKYRDQPFVVIGVHSGKFTQEREAEHIRGAILRHNITHPVVVDSDYEIWNAYHVHAWPTLILIDPEGNIASELSGEGHRERLDESIAKLLGRHNMKGTLSTPMTFKLEKEKFKSRFLNFPGKILADAQGKRLFISDTANHRILITDLDGKVQHIICTGKPGLTNGDFAGVQFREPQGLALSADGTKLFVADRENHVIREVNLHAMNVITIAGTGKQGRDFDAHGPPLSISLNSPWDLALVENDLYIAMAGTHQIWLLNLQKQLVSVFAGTGSESGFDGANNVATFAQPSGLATDGKTLYVADSEISSIRAVELNPNGLTRTVAGSGELFGFGREDGVGKQARFQHPLGVALHGNRLFVADTFNHYIRVVDIPTRGVSTWLGTGTRANGTLEKIGIYEPGGLSIAGDTLYIADTNHQRILAVDINTKKVRIVDVALPGDTSEPKKD